MFQNMITPVNANGGGGTNGFYTEFTPTTNEFTEIDLGFIPTRVFLYVMYPATNVSTPLITELEVATGKYWQWYSSYAKIDETSHQSPIFYIQGTKVYYKAYNSTYAGLTYMIAIKE